MRDRPEFPAPAALGAVANPAARDVFKRATDSRAAASICAAILDSIGDANCLVIADPDTDTLHLSPRDIIIAMTLLHETMTGAEVDAAYTPEEKAHRNLRPPRSHRGFQRNPWPTSNSQLHNILAHSNPRPFAGNLEGYEDGADEDIMAGVSEI